MAVFDRDVEDVIKVKQLKSCTSSYQTSTRNFQAGCKLVKHDIHSFSMF